MDIYTDHKVAPEHPLQGRFPGWHPLRPCTALRGLGHPPGHPESWAETAGDQGGSNPESSSSLTRERRGRQSRETPEPRPRASAIKKRVSTCGRHPGKDLVLPRSPLGRPGKGHVRKAPWRPDLEA